jgi:hypothetical protein
MFLVPSSDTKDLSTFEPKTAKILTQREKKTKSLSFFKLLIPDFPKMEKSHAIINTKCTQLLMPKITALSPSYRSTRHG